mgnify:CR=1 FL=1
MKLTDRSGIDRAFAVRGNCDDVLMAKNGLLTDTSYCNILLFDGIDWITPLQPLLTGVQREYLLHEKIIKFGEIHLKDLNNYKSLMLVNAMLVFNEDRSIFVSQIEN